MASNSPWNNVNQNAPRPPPPASQEGYQGLESERTKPDQLTQSIFADKDVGESRLQAISTQYTSLHAQSSEISTTVATQNSQLARISDQLSHLDTRIKRASQRIRGYLSRAGTGEWFEVAVVAMGVIIVVLLVLVFVK